MKARLRFEIQIECGPGKNNMHHDNVDIKKPIQELLEKQFQIQGSEYTIIRLDVVDITHLNGEHLLNVEPETR